MHCLLKTVPSIQNYKELESNELSQWVLKIAKEEINSYIIISHHNDQHDRIRNHQFYVLNFIHNDAIYILQIY
jgi:hypothetical protein